MCSEAYLDALLQFGLYMGRLVHQGDSLWFCLQLLDFKAEALLDGKQTAKIEKCCFSMDKNSDREWKNLSVLDGQLNTLWEFVDVSEP